MQWNDDNFTLHINANQGKMLNIIVTKLLEEELELDISSAFLSKLAVQPYLKILGFPYRNK